MIVVKLELWPGGSEDDAIDLGKAEISNDLTGSLESRLELGDYNVRILTGAMYSRSPGRLWKKGRVTGFPRRSKRVGPWELLFLALRAAGIEKRAQVVARMDEEAS